VGGVIGVLSPPGNSSLTKLGIADKGVLAEADRAESSDGKVAVTGVVNCASFGLAVGMVMVVTGDGGDLSGRVGKQVRELCPLLIFFLKPSE